MKRQTIHSKRHGVYVHRYPIIWWERLLLVVVHKFLSRDEDPPHSHGNWNVSIVLSGTGTEEICNTDGEVVRSRTLRPGMVIFRRRNQIHRLHATPTITTLFVHGPATENWGFYEPGKYTSGFEFSRSGRSDKFMR